MDRFFLKVKDFFKVNKDYCLVTAIVLVLFNIILIMNGCFPYGSNTVLMGDAQVQIGSFFGHLFNVFEGKSTLFYSNYLGGGVEIFSTVEYMLLNPFYLIVLISGKNNIFYSFNFAVMFMFVFNATVFYWFVKKYFPNIDAKIKFLLTIFFTFSTYITTNFCFVTWLIYPALTLLLVDKFLKLVNDGKILSFVLILTWYVINCFSIGIFTNIILVLLFSAYIFITKTKEEQKPIFARLLVAYFIAVLASLVILLPAIVALFETSRTSSIFTNLFGHNFNNATVSKIGVLCAEGIFYVFAIYHLIKCDKKLPKNKFYIFALAVATAILLFGECTYLIAGVDFNGFYYRFYFINQIILYIVALEFFNAKYTLESKEKNEFKLYKILHYVFVFVLVFCLIWWFVLTLTKQSLDLKSVYPEKGVGIMLMLIFGVIFVGFAFDFIVCKKGLIDKKLLKQFSYLALAVTFATSFFSLALRLGGGITMYEVRPHTQVLDENTKLKLYSPHFSYNINEPRLGVRTNAIFSSLTSDKTLVSQKNLGYYVSDVTTSTQHGNLVSDALTANKYYISFEELDRPYLKLVSSENHLYLYENTLATSGAVFIDEEFSFDSNLTKLENLTNLKNVLGVSGDLVIIPEMTSEEFIGFDLDYANFITKYSYTATEDGILYINKNIINYNESYNKAYDSYFYDLLNGGLMYSVETFIVDDVYSDMMFVKAGETIEFYVTGLGDSAPRTDESIKFQFMNYSVAEEMITKLQSTQAKLDYTKDGYKITLNNNSSGRLVVFNADINGMNYKIDNVEVEANHEFGYFVTFDVAEGSTVIEAEYRFPASKIWIILTVVAVVLIVVILILYKKTEFKFMQKIIRYAFVVVNCGIMVVFVFFGMILTIFRIWL